MGKLKIKGYEVLADGSVLLGNWSEEERIEQRNQAQKNLDKNVEILKKYIDKKICNIIKNKQ